MKKTMLKASLLFTAVLTLGAQVHFAYAEESSSVASSEMAKAEMMLKDGEYTAVSDPDQRGWSLKLVVVVKDGKVVSSTYDNVNDKGEKKSENEEYNKKMKEGTGVSVKEAMSKLDEAFVKDPASVEVVTGATETSTMFQLATKALLKSAAEGKTEEVNISKLKLQDGTYTLETEADQRGWATKFILVVKDGKITESNYDMVNPEGKLKTADEDYNKMMAEKSKVSFADAVKQLNEAVVQKQNAQVEVVSGATNTSKAFKAYAQQLVNAALVGDQTVIKAKLMAE